MTIDSWPLFGIRIRTPRVELRLVRDDELDLLVELARSIDGTPGVFLGPWSALPDPEFGRNIVQFQWRSRADWTAESWQLPLGVFVDQKLLGLQDVGAENFATLQEVATGSWLASAYAGTGIGTEMRAAVLHFAFEGLGAVVARSSAKESNAASLRVSEKLGYRTNGSKRVVFGDEQVAKEVLLELTRERWQPTRRSDIKIEGLDHCLDLFGISPQDS
jgi:RimJ/RimL family protein N-acetyltransferase